MENWGKTGTVILLGIPQAIGLFYGVNISTSLKETLKESFDKYQTNTTGAPTWLSMMQIDFDAMWAQMPSVDGEREAPDHLCCRVRLIAP